MRSFMVADKNVYTSGEVKDKAIVFLHGNSLDAQTFKYQFQFLHGMPLVAFDLPGHGLSKKASDAAKTYSIPGYINSLEEVIHELGIRDFILAGHSLGGHIAIEATEKLKGIKGLLIMGTPPITIPPKMEEMFFPNPAAGILFKETVMEEEALEFAKNLIIQDSGHLKLLSSSVLKTDGAARVNLGASLGQGLFQDELAIIHKLTIPVAVLHGQQDAIVNPEYFRYLNTSALWEEKVHYIPGAAHMPQIEQPEETSKLIRKFYSFVFRT
jgi:pimeloyl-ACP methyl ester carboxylesterase